MYISVIYSTPIKYMKLQACAMRCLQIHFCFGDITALTIEWHSFKRNKVFCASGVVLQDLGKIARYLAAKN